MTGDNNRRASGYRRYHHRIQETAQVRLQVRPVGADSVPAPGLQRVPPIYLDLCTPRGHPVGPHPGSRALGYRPSEHL
ncbi:hypothetical protein DPMN_076148 [Dreissena polymorpha]|uniref:Uncharacterized protein n=1 Tax=Dreissena polymorpha TaxID=45954 RepID=A0A9D3YLU3_DREPO|nr:hypothetical protein DPMN_076148 [Dreissena polymorpha]